MKDKKHIDRLFQEKLKNLEATPNNAVWDRISTQLGEEGGQSKAAPIWWRLAGIAAGLLLLVALGDTVITNTSNSNGTMEEVPTEIVDTNAASEDALNEDTTGTEETTSTSDKVGIDESKGDALKNNLVPKNQIVNSKERPSENNSLLNDPKDRFKAKNVKKTSSSAISAIAKKGDTNKASQTTNVANDSS